MKIDYLYLDPGDKNIKQNLTFGGVKSLQEVAGTGM